MQKEIIHGMAIPWLARHGTSKHLETNGMQHWNIRHVTNFNRLDSLQLHIW